VRAHISAAVSTIVSVDTALVGSMAKRKSSHMRRGKVTAPEPEIRGDDQLANDVMKATGRQRTRPAGSAAASPEERAAGVAELNRLPRARIDARQLA